jgi:hypothetical protein
MKIQLILNLRRNKDRLLLRYSRFIQNAPSFPENLALFNLDLHRANFNINIKIWKHKIKKRIPSGSGPTSIPSISHETIPLSLRLAREKKNRSELLLSLFVHSENLPSKLCFCGLVPLNFFALRTFPAVVCLRGDY